MTPRAPIDLVVTCDLERFLELQFTRGMLQPCVAAIVHLRERFLSDLRRGLPPNYRLTVLDATHISNELHQMVLGSTLPIVSLDNTTITWAKKYFRITTLIENSGGISWVSKSAASIDHQLSALASLGKIALVDIGSQGGAVIEECIGRLPVSEVYLGICGKLSLMRIERTGVPVRFVHYYEQLQWVELRDFLGLDGRRFTSGNTTKKLSAMITFINNAHVSPAVQDTLRRLCDNYRTELMLVLKRRGLDTCLFDDVIVSSSQLLEGLS